MTTVMPTSDGSDHFPKMTCASPGTNDERSWRQVRARSGSLQLFVRFLAGWAGFPGFRWARTPCLYRSEPTGDAHVLLAGRSFDRNGSLLLVARGAGCAALPRDALYHKSAIALTPPELSRHAKELNADTAFYLPNDMLVKVDRMSMAHGLEVRVPFLDAELVRYCANLPGHFKLYRGRKRKHILRESLRGSVPNQILDRPKSGFNIPVEKWMRGPLRDLLFDVVSTRADDLGGFLDVGELRQVVRDHGGRRADHGYPLFTVLLFALWLDNAATAWKDCRPGPEAR